MKYFKNYNRFVAYTEGYDHDRDQVAGDPVVPEPLVYHVSSPKNRADIQRNGLQCSTGEYYNEFSVDGKLSLVPAVFATNSDNELYWWETDYDDDVWEIDTTQLKNQWYNDLHFNNNPDYPHIVTFESIPPHAMTLFYEGSGKSKDEMWDNNEW